MEALISILIFAFGILGLLGLEASAIKTSDDAEDRNRASLFASEVASAMWLAGSVSTANPQLALQVTAWNTSVANAAGTGLPNGLLTFAPVATITNSAGTVIATDITITWKPPSHTAATLSTLTTRVILP